MSMNYTANDIQTLDFRTAIRSRIAYKNTKTLEETLVFSTYN